MYHSLKTSFITTTMASNKPMSMNDLKQIIDQQVDSKLVKRSELAQKQRKVQGEEIFADLISMAKPIIADAVRSLKTYTILNIHWYNAGKESSVLDFDHKKDN